MRSHLLPLTTAALRSPLVAVAAQPGGERRSGMPPRPPTGRRTAARSRARATRRCGRSSRQRLAADARRGRSIPREGAFSGRFQVNPIVVDGVLYTITPGGSAIALDGATGAREVVVEFRRRAAAGRGVTYWSDGNERRILAGFGRYVYALDAATGQPIDRLRARRTHRSARRSRPRSGTAVVSLRHARRHLQGPATSSADARPRACRHRPATSAPTTSAPARCAGRFTPSRIPANSVYETWPKDAWTYTGAANNWAGHGGRRRARASSTSRPDPRPRTSTAPIASATTCSPTRLLALDAETGKRIWHFQAVKHDIWDRDFPRRRRW